MQILAPNVQAIRDIEARQDELLRQLDDLEQRIALVLADFTPVALVLGSVAPPQQNANAA